MSLSKCSRYCPALVLAVFLFQVALPMVTGRQQTEKGNPPSYQEEIQKWKADRVKSLAGENGWVTLTGLFWLNQGENKVGSDSGAAVVLPAGKAPAQVGSLWLNGSAVRLSILPGVDITASGSPVKEPVDLKSDADGKPTQMSIGSVVFIVIKRGDKIGIRVRDKQSPERTSFAGLDYYPADPKWRVEAKLEPYNPPKMIPIVNILGMVEDSKSPGTLRFTLNGQAQTIDPILEEDGATELFLIFADQTSGKETYGAGRYIYTSLPDADGKVIIDFNKAFNPPCAFTKYATCPLPPRQNRLSTRIEAGEKKYAGHDH